MKKIVGLFLGLILLSPVFSQFDGNWQGVLMQKNQDGTTSSFSIWVKLKSEGKILSGKLRSEQVSSPYFKISEVVCEKKGSTIFFEEMKIMNHKTQSGLKWCLIKAKLYYNEEKQQLKGTYLSKNDWCVGGELVLLKSNKQFNESNTETVEETSIDNVKELLSGEGKVEGKQFVLEDVSFLSGKYTLTSKSNKSLNEIAAILQKNKSIIIHLKGHTDSDGDDETNFILSQKRAQSVANYLISKGIKSERITYEGHGEARPLVKNDSPENKQINRRVELLILSQ